MADEAAVEEGGLVDDLGVGAQRLEGLGVRPGEVVGGVAGPLELHDPAGVRPGQPAQLGLLVLVAQGDDPRGHRVVGDDGPLAAAEHDVELADQRELARRCRAQVARADDEPTVVAEEEHAPNLTPATDSGPGSTSNEDDPCAGCRWHRKPSNRRRWRTGASGLGGDPTGRPSRGSRRDVDPWRPQIQLGNHIRQRHCSYGMVSAT